MRNNAKMNVRLFSINQLVRSVVPTNEFVQAERNAVAKTIVHTFLEKGTLSFDIAIVKLIIIRSWFV